MGYYSLDVCEWFTGPKITLSVDDLSNSQEEALADEGLEVEKLEDARLASIGHADGGPQKMA